MCVCVHAPIAALSLGIFCRCVCLSLQEDMLQTRRDEFEDSVEELTSWDGFVKALDNKKMVRTPW